MTSWLVVSPQREDDEALRATAWVARKTIDHAEEPPESLLDSAATRENFERSLAENPGLAGIAFFGHGGEDRLFSADRAPESEGPALIDPENVALLRGRWVHAFACNSGKELACHAIRSGAQIYVGYRRPLDAGWDCPPSAEHQFIRLVTSTTLALLSGERDERTLRSKVSAAADDFFEALEALPDDQRSKGWMWLHALSQQLVDGMVVAHP
jgi:hypothetical protein